LATSASLEGRGLFTAQPARLLLHPAPPDSGIVFQRTDLPGSPAIPALATHVIPESRRTLVSANPADRGAASVQTVEHLMSALAGLGVTDARLELDGPEVPIADGSARPFVDTIRQAGVVESGVVKRPSVVVTSRIELSDPKHGASIIAEPTPWPGLELEYHLEYPPGSPIPPQSAAIRLPLATPASDYAQAVALARTFSTLQEAQMARQMGLFGHVSPRDMLVIGPDGPIENAYRIDAEPARHKLLDLLGDLALSGLLGRGIQGRVVARRTGHAHNHEMARRLMTLG
jgi:UDP-3-O-acyl-N-acetylglucosamine deacetylase